MALWRRVIVLPDPVEDPRTVQAFGDLLLEKVEKGSPLMQWEYASVWYGEFSYLSVADLKACVRETAWARPRDVQVLVRDDTCWERFRFGDGPRMLEVFLGWARKRGFDVHPDEAAGLLRVLRVDPEETG